VKKNKVYYKRAIKKQMLTITVIIGIVISYPMLLGKSMTDMQLYLWLMMVAMTTYSVFLLLKNQSKEAKCPHCEADLFEVIQLSQQVKLDFNFCPKCGEKIEI